MSTQNLPGTDAARHGTGDADLTIMLVSHQAFRRDLAKLAKTVASAPATDPARQASIQAGWEMFKLQLHNHHTGEDKMVWPVLRERLAQSSNAQSVLDAMEAEHGQIDPVLAAMDSAFADGADKGQLSAATDTLTSMLDAHLAHEERDALPLIGSALTASEWRQAGIKMGRMVGLSNIGVWFGWMLDDATPADVQATFGMLPAPVKLIYRTVWKRRYEKVQRW